MLNYCYVYCSKCAVYNIATTVMQHHAHPQLRHFFPYYRPQVLGHGRDCQRNFNKEAGGQRKEAQLSQTVMALLMYTSITSGHSKEYATLQFEVHGDQLLPSQVRRLNAPNWITITERGDAKYIALSDYKMSKLCGCDHIVLGSDSHCSTIWGGTYNCAATTPQTTHPGRTSPNLHL